MNNSIDQSGILALSTRLQRISERLRKDGLQIYKENGIEFEPKWFPVIYTLQQKNSLSIGELAAEIGYAHPSTISLLKELEKEKLISSTKDKTDDRRRLISLTPKAEELIDKMKPVWGIMIAAMTELTDTTNNIMLAINEVDAAFKKKSFLERALAIMEEKKEGKVSEDRIEVSKIANPEDLKTAFAIRRQVFVIDQNVDAAAEEDGNDVATHYLAKVNDLPAGTARWRKTKDGYKLERFAVLNAYRGSGVGGTLVQALLSDLPEGARAYLHAQVRAAKFYEKNGFSKFGDLFVEQNIEHVKMELYK
ncbi:bifunctional helix-turn-helix transcriptional regulator/GNAT family N-acetyltransferase [Dyadobacter sp. 3J3]|uniref:bifunctional helix-turn-helix transcriptional regulator/GNAT family N-acetyltransferase n=1 Tax=Dyadobacter sp. 3J3 TaxID=2606600 RepID=UPI00190F4923|nr:bifunctional helix-turn-helix transcriptional regulator/GNAT family N-acetyltransferase [Dyadobacter sp. 3J3]